MSLTLIKCKNENPTSEDLEKLRIKVINEESLDNENVDIEVLDLKPTSLTLVKIGNEKYQPSLADLEIWREVFEEAGTDPDFKIFTHSAVTVEQLPFQSEDNVFIISSSKMVTVKQNKPLAKE